MASEKYGERETIRMYGKTWGRYPDAKGSGRRYYHSSMRLHVYVWEMHNGMAVPEGYIIHHIDFDPANNEIENLACMPGDEHRALHLCSRSPEETERLRQHAASIRPLTKAWHASKEGREWHKRNGFKAWDGRERDIEVSCSQCGKEYLVYFTREHNFCCLNCKAKFRRVQGLDDEARNCPICGREFIVNKYARKKTCDRMCAAQLTKKTIKLRYG